jgi:hypothetical protein
MRLFFRFALVLALGLSTTAWADTVTYANAGNEAPLSSFTAVNTGTVAAYFYGTDAAYTSLLGMSVNGVQVGGWVLNNHSSSVGQSVVLGNVNAGDSISFSLFVTDTNQIFSSDATLNADHFNHIYAMDGFAGDGLIPAGTYIGFEDLFGGGDKDYNDAQFVLTNVTDPAPLPTPEPSSLLLLGSGMAGLLGIVRRKVNL